MEIYDRISLQLRASGISDRKASVDAGLSPDFIRDLKRGRSRNPTYDGLVKLARYLKCDIEHLVGSDGPQSIVADAAEKRGNVNLKINQTVTFDQATRIFAILGEGQE